MLSDRAPEALFDAFDQAPVAEKYARVAAVVSRAPPTKSTLEHSTTCDDGQNLDEVTIGKALPLNHYLPVASHDDGLSDVA